MRGTTQMAVNSTLH